MIKFGEITYKIVDFKRFSDIICKRKSLVFNDLAGFIFDG